MAGARGMRDMSGRLLSAGDTFDGWRLTGGLRERRTPLGRKGVEGEEGARVYRPVVTGYTPGNFRMERRFRPALVVDLLEIADKMHVASIFPQFEVGGPPPPTEVPVRPANNPIKPGRIVAG